MKKFGIVCLLIVAIACLVSPAFAGDLSIKDAKIIAPPGAGTSYTCEIILQGFEGKAGKYEKLRAVYEFPATGRSKGSGAGLPPVRDRKLKPDWEKGTCSFEFTTDNPIEYLTVWLAYEEGGKEKKSPKFKATVKK